MNASPSFVLWALAALAAGCAEVSKTAGDLSQGLRAAVAAGGAGGAAERSGAPSDLLAQQEPPAAGTAPATAPTRSAPPPAAPGAATAPARPPATVVVGRKRLPLASQELDKNCSQVVAPFDIDVNLASLGGLLAGGAQQGLGDLIRGLPAAGHRLSKPVREQAMRMNWLPMSVEKRYGAHLHQRNLGQQTLLSRDEREGRRLYPVADRILARILQGAGPTDYAFELHVRKANDDNAIALPGGYVYVDASLLQSPAKLPLAHFALSHEIAHVLQRHETRLVQARIIDTVSLTGSARDLLDTLRNPGQISDELLRTAATGKGAFQRHYESQELQADACAVRVLDNALDNLAEVDAAINAFMASLSQDEAPAAAPNPGPQRRPVQAGTPDLLEEVARPMDRHPSSAERMANLAAMRKAIAAQRASAGR